MTDSIADYRVVGEGSDSLFFLHGLGGDLTNWHPQLDAFSASHTCVAWTLPGYGQSPGLAELTWPALADAVVRVLDEVRIERATIVGLSMGGYIAQQLAVDHGDRVDRLVLAATSARFGRGSTSFTEKFLAARLAPLDDGETPADLAPDVARGLVSTGASSDTVANCVASMSRISPEAYRRALGLLVTWDIADRLAEITAPTLCVAGADDQTAPVAALAALADALPNAELEVIENCNHLINLDRPDAFNAALGRFIG